MVLKQILYKWKKYNIITLTGVTIQVIIRPGHTVLKHRDPQGDSKGVASHSDISVY